MWRQRLSEISDDRRVATAIWWSTVALLGLLHLFIHHVNIGHAELWLDESSTWGVARRSLGTVFTLPTEFHSQPPLYYLLLHFVMKLSDARSFMRSFSWLHCLLLLQFVLFYVEELNLGARVFFCVLFLFSALPGYLSSALRPYGLAALLSFVSTILFLRMVREPTRRRSTHYAIATLLMLYTMAFDVWVLVAQGVCWLVRVLVRIAQDGLRTTLARQRAPLCALIAIGVGYLPYLLMAIHWQYASNASDNSAQIWTLAHAENIANEFFRFAAPLMTILYLFVAVGLWGELRARNPMVLTWLLIAFGQVAFVVAFMYGRNTLGPQGRYITPAFPSVCMLAALGFQHLAPRLDRAAWQLLPVALAILAWPLGRAYVTSLETPVPLGDMGKLRAAMAQQPGPKAIFFDVGYAGQDFEYVARHDADTHVFTMRGRGLASGGDDHLEAEYVLRSIAETRDVTRCFYYFGGNAQGVYGETFVPEVTRLGYQELPRIAHAHRFCR